MRLGIESLLANRAFVLVLITSFVTKAMHLKTTHDKKYGFLHCMMM